MVSKDSTLAITSESTKMVSSSYLKPYSVVEIASALAVNDEAIAIWSGVIPHETLKNLSRFLPIQDRRDSTHTDI